MSATRKQLAAIRTLPSTMQSRRGEEFLSTEFNYLSIDALKRFLSAFRQITR